jgi:ABC-type glycerol-3-phosphate transport system substrate-binding protein
LAYQLFKPSSNAPSTQASTIPTTKITLQFWGVFDDPTVFQPIINAYQAAHPNVTVTYSRKELSLYEFVSLNLLASQEGPDVWLIPSEWLPKHADKLNTVPEGFLSAQNIAPVKTSFFQKKPAIATNAALFNQIFAPVTADNNLVNNKIKVIPLSVDTLGLYSNSTLLQEAGLTSVPTTWDAVVIAAQKLAKRSTTTINQPAINLGGGGHAPPPPPILAPPLLPKQNPLKIAV